MKAITDGGEGGIRTRGQITPTHAFQACLLNHCSTSPRYGRFIIAYMGRKVEVPKKSYKNGGEGGIRTHVPIAREPLFESGTMNHSDTSPRFQIF